jgi:hypothetical protein
VRAAVAAVAASILLCGVASAADNGRVAAPFLTRTESALPAALGDAFTAANGRLEAAFANPAGVASLPETKILSTYQNGLVDDALGAAEFGWALGFGTLYAGFGYYDAGTIDVNLTGGVTGSRRLEQDMVGALGGAIGRNGPFAVGAVIKGLRSEVAEEATATGFAADVGALWRTPLRGLSFGAAGVNLGPSVEFEAESDPLPTATRVGAAYELDFSKLSGMKSNPYMLSLYADGVSQRRDRLSGRGGIELSRRMTTADKAGRVAIRGGYRSRPTTFTAGLGFELGAFGLDYALGIVQDVDNSHRISLSWRFVPPESRPVIRRRTK